MGKEDELRGSKMVSCLRVSFPEQASSLTSSRSNKCNRILNFHENVIFAVARFITNVFCSRDFIMHFHFKLIIG